MGEWEMVRLGDVGTFHSGGTPSRSKSEYYDGKIPWITTTALGPLYICEDSANEFITEAAIKNSATKIIPSSSLLIGTRVGVGKASINTVPLCTNQDILAIVVDNEETIHLPYIYNYLKTKKDYFDSQKRGATIQGIKGETIKELRVPMPPLPVQQKIAGVLDRASALIEKRKAQIEKLDLLVKSQFIQMFGDPVTNPMGWAVKRLGELFKVRSSKRVYQSEQTDDGVPFLRVSDLTNRIINGVDSCNLYITEELYSAFEETGYVPKTGDILVTSRGTLGLCYIVRNTDKFYFQDGMISWLSRQEINVNSDYIMYLFYSDDIKRQIERASAGSTVGYLSLANLENLNVMFPPLTLQTQFAAFVERVEAQKTQMKQGLELMELEYKSLMQKCFNGELY